MKLRCGYPLTEGLAGLEKNVEMVRADARRRSATTSTSWSKPTWASTSPTRGGCSKRLEPYQPRWVGGAAAAR